jgi:hypothetical protein
MTPADPRDPIGDALRRGTTETIATPTDPRADFDTRSVDLGRPRLAKINNIAEVLAIAEGETWR